MLRNLLFFMIMILPILGFASARLGIGLGYGIAELSTVDGLNTEGPGAFDLFIDMPVSPVLMIGAEHVRSLEDQPVGSGVGLTGVVLKWYFLEPVVQNYLENALTKDEVRVISWTPYIGVAAGMAHATIASDISYGSYLSAVGFYSGIKGGIEYPLLGRYGVRFESNYIETLSGTGKIKAMNFLFGGYVYF